MGKCSDNNLSVNKSNGKKRPSRLIPHTGEVRRPLASHKHTSSSIVPGVTNVTVAVVVNVVLIPRTQAS